MKIGASIDDRRVKHADQATQYQTEEVLRESHSSNFHRLRMALLSVDRSASTRNWFGETSEPVSTQECYHFLRRPDLTTNFWRMHTVQRIKTRFSPRKRTNVLAERAFDRGKISAILQSCNNSVWPKKGAFSTKAKLKASSDPTVIRVLQQHQTELTILFVPRSRGQSHNEGQLTLVIAPCGILFGKI
jgi:hypothetical protein